MSLRFDSLTAGKHSTTILPLPITLYFHSTASSYRPRLFRSRIIRQFNSTSSVIRTPSRCLFRLFQHVFSPFRSAPASLLLLVRTVHLVVLKYKMLTVGFSHRRWSCRPLPPRLSPRPRLALQPLHLHRSCSWLVDHPRPTLAHSPHRQVHAMAHRCYPLCRVDCGLWLTRGLRRSSPLR